MDRRAFALDAARLAGALALVGATPARAQAQDVNNERPYTRLARPLPMADTGRIEVIEFFWYGCPHCFAFEPLIEPWVTRLPADVHFRRIPVGFDALKQVHQQVFHTWEVLGLVDQMHLKTFTRFHVQKRWINREQDMLDFARENGLDVDKVKQAWNGFSVQTKMRQSTQLTDQYEVAQTPSMGIQGRFTAVAVPGHGPASVLTTTEYLVDRIRQGG